MDIISLVLSTKYPALFVLSFLEGPVTMSAAGFLLKLGYFSVFPVYAAVLLGDLAGDMAWYAAGYFGGHIFIRRFGSYFGLTEEVATKLAARFRKHERNILLISKLTMGFGFAVATLFTAGMSKVPFRKFVWLNFLGGLIWTAGLMSLGYVFGNIYQRVSEDLRIVSIVCFVTVLVGALFAFRRAMKNRASQGV